MKTEWEINGKTASARDAAEVLKLHRQHRAKIAAADREGRERDAIARAVGAALRRQAGPSIGCRPAFVRGHSNSTRRLRRFEAMVGLNLTARMAGARQDGGVSSFHFKLTPRGLGQRRRAQDRPYKPGEAARTIRYILREAAREISGGGIVSNVSHDPDKIASLFAALEELEFVGGRANANVYVSLIVSLPADLTAAQRANLLAEICAPLGRQSLPHAGVLHAPDPEGDQRNFHAHVVFSWRPFEVHDDRYYLSAGTLGAQNDTEFVTALRQDAATAMNRAMSAAGHDRRFTAEKTRKAPAAAAQDKLSTGQKHRQRRAAHISEAEQERSLRQDRAEAYGSTAAVAKRWLTRQVADRTAALSAITARDAERAVTQKEVRTPETTASAGPNLESPRTHPGVVVAVSQRKPALSTPTTVVTPAPNTSASPPPATAELVVSSTGPSIQSHVPATPISPPPKPATVAQRSVATTTGAAVVGFAHGLDNDPSASSQQSSTPKKEDDHARTRRNYLAALTELRRELDPPKPGPDQARRLDEAGTLASVRRLPEFGLVRDLAKLEVLLPRLPQDQLVAEAGERSDMGGGDGVRRPGAGDRADQPEDGEERLITEPKESKPPPVGPILADGNGSLHDPVLSKVIPASTFRRRRAGATDRLRTTAQVRARDNQQAKISRRELLLWLEQQTYLPIRPTKMDDDGPEFTLQRKYATTVADAGLLTQAIAIEADADIQALLRQKFEAFLAHLRGALTTSRRERPPSGKLDWLFEENEQLQSALAAASGSEALTTTYGIASAYWDDLDHANLAAMHDRSKGRDR